LDIGNGKIRCKACGTVYIKEQESNRLTDEVRRLNDEVKKEHVSNARKNLYQELSAKYINSKRVISACDKIKEYLPDDFVANFYLAANSENLDDFVNALIDITPSIAAENYPFIEGIVNFTIKSLDSRLILPLENLIDNAYYGIDDQKRVKFRDEIEAEALKIQEGLYDPTIERDIFVLYSSADMQKVLELVDFLEGHEGLSCFIARRNLQVGRHAEQDYESKIYTAMDHCKCLVYVSSPNSRKRGCDAFDIEREYQTRKDRENAPFGHKNDDYELLPLWYKKPRIEYFIEASAHPTVADKEISKVFFAGLNRSETLESVAESFYRRHITFGAPIDPPTPGKITQTPDIQVTIPEEPNSYHLENAKKAYDAKKYKDAFINFKQAAEESGDASAMCTLGYLYEVGRGVNRNTQKASEWYNRAAEGGNAQAQHNLAVCYELGIGTDKNPEKAEEWFNIAAENGSEAAKAYLESR
jgi:hypothetical protein